jgi:hypothetical protein
MIKPARRRARLVSAEMRSAGDIAVDRVSPILTRLSGLRCSMTCDLDQWFESGEVEWIA